MYRTTKRIVPIVLCGMLSLLIVAVNVFGQAATQPMYQPAWVKADPPEVDFGEIATMDTKAATLTLVNTDSQPHKVKSVRPSCGCTAVKFVPDTVIEANSKLDVPLQLSGGATEGPILHKIVTVVVEGQADFTVPLKGHAVSYVTITPMPIDPDVNMDGKITLKSKDGQAFRVLSMQPPVIKEFPPEAKAEHELKLDWARFNEIGQNRRITFYLDHPKCQQAIGTVNFRNPPQVHLIDQPVIADTFPTQLDNDISSGKTADAIRQIEKTADVEGRDHGGISLLSKAARAGNIELMKYLLEHGAKLESTNNAGLTPLMFAAQSKNADAVRFLLKAGASITARGQVGGTAVSWASGLGNAESVRVLIEAGSDVEVVDKITGWTPLIWAAGFGDPDSIPILLKAGAKLEETDLQQGSTPLIMAARTGKPEAIRELVKAGAKLEARDNTGCTALLAAATNSGGSSDKVKVLIELGADIHARNNQGKNALELASKRTDVRATDVVAVLRPMLAAETPAAESTVAK